MLPRRGLGVGVEQQEVDHDRDWTSLFEPGDDSARTVATLRKGAYGSLRDSALTDVARAGGRIRHVDAGAGDASGGPGSLLVYGIAEADDIDTSGVGLDGRPLRAVAEGPLVAVVSDQDGRDPEPTPQRSAPTSEPSGG